jgi:hypothetical protein
VLIVFTILVKKIEKERYLDNDYLTKEQELELKTIPGIIIEYYDNNQRTYTFCCNFK